MDFFTYVSVFLLAMLKFFISVMTGLANGFSWVELMLTAGLGSAISVPIYLYFGKWLSRWVRRRFNWRKRQRSFRQRRRIVYFWRRWGLAGVSLLIPLISPQLAIAIALTFGERAARIILYLLLSIFFWVTVCSLLRDVML